MRVRQLKGAGRGIVFVCIPESGVVHRIDGQRAVIAQRLAGAALAAGSIKQVGFTLTNVFKGSVASRAA